MCSPRFSGKVFLICTVSGDAASQGHVVLITRQDGITLKSGACFLRSVAYCISTKLSRQLITNYSCEAFLPSANNGFGQSCCDLFAPLCEPCLTRALAPGLFLNFLGTLLSNTNTGLVQFLRTALFCFCHIKSSMFITAAI